MELIKRLPGELTTLDNRADSDEKVNRAKRYQQILEILEDFKMATAKEIAVEMKKRGYARTDERNLTAPRLTEMLSDGRVDVCGKIYDTNTNRHVTVFEIGESNEKVV